MVIVPDSDIILIKSPLKLDNYNQMTFNDASSQYNYFISLPHLEYDGCTYVRKDGVIRYNTNKEDNINAPRFEDLLGYNYCMYRNDSYSNKWFYAFITDIKYINDGMSEVTIETDAFQSWQFDLNYMNSFIEREHVGDDSIGLHTIPEGLETGEYIVNNWNQNDTLKSNTILVASTIDLSTYASDGGGAYGGVYQGYNLYSFSNTSTGRTALQNRIMQMNQDQKLDAIVGIFIANPMFYTTDSTSDGAKVTPESSPRGFTWGRGGAQTDVPISKLNTLNGYTPKNNKMKTYPFMYLLMDNGNGSQAIYKYEDFKSDLYPNTCEFDIIGTPSFGGSYYVTPLNYGGTPTDNWKNRLHGGKLPTCGFQNDTWINWITQNAVPIITSAVDDAFSIGMGTSAIAHGSLSGISSIKSGISGIANTLNTIEQHSKVPPQHVGNADTGDINFTAGLTTFTAYAMSIKYEYAKMIDDFFTMYGYKVNRLATPNIHKRVNWDYIKTIDVNIEGNVPEKDLDTIRGLFNNGCTFWHNPSTFLNYSASNGII